MHAAHVAIVRRSPKCKEAGNVFSVKKEEKEKEKEKQEKEEAQDRDWAVDIQDGEPQSWSAILSD